MSDPILRLEHLRKSFGGVAAIQDTSFEIAESSITALIGPNGAGKTTLFNLITGLETPDGGTTHFYGRLLNGAAAHRIAALGLIRTFQSARIFPSMTVQANILVGAHQYTKVSPFSQGLWLPAAAREERDLMARAERLLSMIGLSSNLGMPATDLPMGAQKLLEVARALMARPRLLLLDEPAAGLNDNETMELAMLLRSVREAGVTILVVEHNMSLVMSLSDRVIVLDGGKVIADGTPAEIRDDPHVLEAYLGTRDGALAC